MDRIRVLSLFPLLLEEHGLSPSHVLRQARLPQTLLQQEKTSISTAQFFAVWEAIDTLSSDPAIGLKMGSDSRVERYNPASIAALSAHSFRDALTKLARYKQLFCAEEMRLIEQDDGCSIEFGWPFSAKTEPAMLIDAAFASVMELGQRGSGQALRPEWITFKRAERQRAMYEAYFNCPVQFGADRNALGYSLHAIDSPFVTYNPDLLALLLPQLEAVLVDHVAQQHVTAQVKALLRRMLPGQQPTMQDVARELNISAPTLQRRLADDGARFQQVLDTVRREMAQHYLTESSLDLREISYLLGYEEASSFHRAFHHWEGVSPGQWRAVRRNLRAGA